MKPYYSDDAVTIYHGDALEVLPSLGVIPCAISAVVTDPPYKLSQEYSATVDADNLAAVASIAEVLPLALDATEGGGVLAMFYDSRILPFGLDVARRSGWKYLRHLTLYRRWGQASLVNGWMSTSDFVLLFSRPGARPVIGGDAFHDVYVKATAEPESFGHPAQKPLDFVEQIIGKVCSPGDTVLDPYMGSGTTMRAAKNLGRQAIGIEIEERYCEIAAKRMAQEVLDLGA